MDILSSVRENATHLVLQKFPEKKVSEAFYRQTARI